MERFIYDLGVAPCDKTKDLKVALIMTPAIGDLRTLLVFNNKINWADKISMVFQAAIRNKKAYPDEEKVSPELIHLRQPLDPIHYIGQVALRHPVT